MNCWCRSLKKIEKSELIPSIFKKIDKINSLWKNEPFTEKKHIFRMFLTVFPLTKEWRLTGSICSRWSLKKIDQERRDPVNWPWGNRQQEWFNLFHDHIDLLIAKNKRFDGKTNDQNPNPALSWTCSNADDSLAESATSSWSWLSMGDSLAESAVLLKADSTQI